jgi:hypothetical protein
VKVRFLDGQYCSLYRDTDYQYCGESYEAKEVLLFRSRTFRNDVGYTSGFHVFHKLSDARLYRDSRGHTSRVIVKVKLSGKRTTGIQRFDYHELSSRRHWKTIFAKVTVCAKITLLKEVK